MYVDHILECLNWIGRHIAEGKESFFRDRKTQSAVLREIQVLAESTQRLSSTLKDQHPEVFWQGISGFRNILVHDYLGIRLERIWGIIEYDLPLLRKAVETMKRTLETENQ